MYLTHYCPIYSKCTTFKRKLKGTIKILILILVIFLLLSSRDTIGTGFNSLSRALKELHGRGHGPTPAVYPNNVTP